MKISTSLFDISLQDSFMELTNVEVEWGFIILICLNVSPPETKGYRLPIIKKKKKHQI